MKSYFVTRFFDLAKRDIYQNQAKVLLMTNQVNNKPAGASSNRIDHKTRLKIFS